MRNKFYCFTRYTAVCNNAYWDSFRSILNRCPREGVFLEIGAANAEQVGEHKKYFARLVGIDYDFSQLSPSAGIALVNADAQFLPFKENSFDGIISHHVIEHAPDDRLFLREIQRTLKKGGFAILGTPNRRRLVRAFIETFSGKRKFPWREHHREYTYQELMDLTKSVHFKDARIHPSFLGIHSSRIVLGIGSFPAVFNKWCNFLFLELKK